MFYIASTRFNNATYDENISYRKKSSESVIYGTSIRIQSKYDIGALMFVVEMNNEENRIEGIGLIRNTMIYDKIHHIYTNSDYNRYLYRGDYWIDRKTIVEKDAEIAEICDTVLFKGKSHMKRMSGISVLTNQLFTNWDFKLSILKEKIRCLFITYFITHPQTQAQNNIINTNNLKNYAEMADEFEIIVPAKKRKQITLQTNNTSNK
jgi:hypothetical protein